MAVWQDLATELIVEILEWLDDLHATSLTSRQMHAISERLMYTFVDLRGIPTSALPHNDAASLRLRRFIQTLLNRPELGSYTRRIAVGHWAWCDRRHEFTRDLTKIHSLEDADDVGDEAEEFIVWAGWEEDHVDMIVEAAATKGYPPTCFFDHEISSGALFLLAFQFTPHVSVLEIPRGGTIQRTLGATMSGVVPGIIPAAFNSLKIIEVYEGYHGREEFIGLSAVKPIFRIPSLQSCCISNVVHAEPSDQHFHRNDIEHLDLRVCNIDSLLLHGLITAPRALKSFTHTVVWDRIPLHQRSLLDCSTISDALLFQASTLTSICIRDASNGHNLESFGVLDSLSEFPALQHVKLCVELLLGPPSSHRGTPSPPPPSIRSQTSSSSLDSKHVRTHGGRLVDLLPPSLVTLELWLSDRLNIPKFISMTGCPQGWTDAKNMLPNCESFILHCGPDDVTPLINLVSATFQKVGITLSLPAAPGVRRRTITGT